MNVITLDQIMSIVYVVTTSFSSLVTFLGHTASWALDQFLSWYGPDSVIGKFITEVLKLLIAPIGNVPLYEILLGSTLLFFIGWVLLKFFIDSLPLLG